jgi:hypothetical protein
LFTDITTTRSMALGGDGQQKKKKENHPLYKLGTRGQTRANGQFGLGYKITFKCFTGMNIGMNIFVISHLFEIYMIATIAGDKC